MCFGSWNSLYWILIHSWLSLSPLIFFRHCDCLRYQYCQNIHLSWHHSHDGCSHTFPLFGRGVVLCSYSHLMFLYHPHCLFTNNFHTDHHLNLKFRVIAHHSQTMSHLTQGNMHTMNCMITRLLSTLNVLLTGGVGWRNSVAQYL
jgi:hypothetical protein